MERRGWAARRRKEKRRGEIEERRSEKRTYPDNTSSRQGNARECRLTDSSCLPDIQAKPTPPSYTPCSISRALERFSSSANRKERERERNTRVEVRTPRNVSMMRVIRFPFVSDRNQEIYRLIENVSTSLDTTVGLRDNSNKHIAWVVKLRGKLNVSHFLISRWRKTISTEGNINSLYLIIEIIIHLIFCYASSLLR